VRFGPHEGSVAVRRDCRCRVARHADSRCGPGAGCSVRRLVVDRHVGESAYVWSSPSFTSSCVRPSAWRWSGGRGQGQMSRCGGRPARGPGSGGTSVWFRSVD